MGIQFRPKMIFDPDRRCIYRNVSCLSVLPEFQTYLKLPYKQDFFSQEKKTGKFLDVNLTVFFSPPIDFGVISLSQSLFFLPKYRKLTLCRTDSGMRFTKTC